MSVMLQIVLALPVLVFAPIGILLMVRWRAPQAAPEITADGRLSVAVRGLYLRWGGFMGGRSNNSINPRFAIARDGIHYRVFRENMLPFSAIDHIEMRTRFGSPHVLFLNNSGPRLLSVNVGDADTAKRVLNAVPRTVALTPEAATIRDGVASGGTSGLKLYHGPFA